MSRLDEWFEDGWRRCLRWFSVQWMLVTGALLQLVQLAPVIPHEIQSVIPQPWGSILTAAWTFLGLLARLKRQPELDAK
jgi:hypothetical protein